MLRGLLVANAAMVATWVAAAAPPAAPAPSPPAGAPLSAPVAAAKASIPQVPAPLRAALPAGQVWQCVIDGERTFSDSPCGEHASIRQLRELNIMDPVPLRADAYAFPYAPSSVPAPIFVAAPPDDSDYADPWGPDVLWAHGNVRRNYFSRQDNHVHPQPTAHPHPHRGRN